jgi:hypothetical protein
MAFTVADLHWYICVAVEIQAVMAQIVGVIWIVDVKEMGIMKVVRMIVVTKVLLSAKHFIIRLMHTT